MKLIKHLGGDGNRVRERGKDPTVSYPTCQGHVEIVASGALTYRVQVTLFLSIRVAWWSELILPFG